MGLLRGRALDIQAGQMDEVTENHVTHITLSGHVGISKTITEHKDFICSRLTWEAQQHGTKRAQLLGKTISFAFGAQLDTIPHTCKHQYTDSTRPRLIHTRCLQVWCRVCVSDGGTAWMGARPL